MVRTPRSTEHLVVVGSSAGGIEALSILVGSLKPDFAAPVVLAQHLDPNRQSYLPSILERRSSLPIVVVSDHVALEPGKIYVVPSNRHVLINDGSVRVEADHRERPRPSVDLLLSSAAESYGEGVIAVILTGTGSDGAAGAVAVKSAGGQVIIQNPETAAYPFMPQALPPTAVDHVVELDRVGPLLADIVSGTPIPEAIAQAPDVLSEILRIVGTHSSIDFRPYKPATILRRISRRMAVNHIRTLPEYRAFVAGHPAEVQELVRSLLIKVTEFFRDPDAFTFLRRDVMPVLLERGRASGRVLRLWSAGCATGEEAYSLALIVADMLGQELPEWSVKVFATDLDESAIAFARRGLYPENVLGNLPDDYRDRFFERADTGFRIAKHLRQMVIFGQQDISRSVPFPRIDLVVCRNLLIYFKAELQQDVLDRFAYSMHQTKGFLFLGKAETARPSRATFQLVNKKWKVYQCLAGPFTAPAGKLGVGSVGPYRRVDAKRLQASTVRPETEAPDLDFGQFRRLNESVLRHLPLGIVVIDRRYRIRSMNGGARRMLGIRDVTFEHDFLHSARGLPYGDVRAAIDRSFRERAVVTLTDVPFESGVSDSQSLTIQISPLQVGDDEEHALVAITDTSEINEARRRLQGLETEQKALIDEITTANRRLVEVNKELQDANEELQAGNEEMMLTQEELQSTNEEFEATNEELQATNEELETNNEELQATNEELETTNEELTARSGELQEMARILSAERARFQSIVELAPFYIVVLRGGELVVEHFNRRAGLLFTSVNPSGHSLEQVGHAALEPLFAAVRECYRENRLWVSPRLPIRLDWEPGIVSERIFAFTCVPIRVDEDDIDGVVVYGEDVTQQETQEMEERREKLRLIVEHAAQTALALYDAQTHQLLFASPSFLATWRRIARRADDLTEAPDEARTGDQAPAGGTHLPGWRWDDLDFGAQHDTMVASFRDAVSEDRTIRIRELRLGGPDGEESVWDCSLIPIRYSRDAMQEGVRFVCVSGVEVTDAVREREGMAQLDQMKNEFLSMASHELRTPLMPLTAYADVLNRMVGDPKEKELVQKLQQQLRYMTRLTDDLLDVARLATGKFRLESGPVDLRQVVQDAVEQAMPITGRPRIRVSLSDGDGSLTMQGDAGRLMQAVFNLLSNALTHGARSEFVDLSLSREDGAVPHGVIEVTDYGPGVPQQERERIFDRFFQLPERESSRKGLGLGLYICRSIVEEHGGTIEARALEPNGTTFRMRLPLGTANR